MNKKLLLPAVAATAFVAGMAAVPNSVSAASDSPDCNALTSKNTGKELATCLATDPYSATIKAGETLTIDSAENNIAISNNDAKLTLGEGSKILYTADTKNLFTVNYVSFDVSGNGTIETTQIGGENNSNQQIVAILYKGAAGKHLTIGQDVTLKGQTPLYFSSNKPTGVADVDVYGTIEGISADYAAVFAPWNLEESVAPNVTMHNTAVIKNPDGGPAVSLGGYTNFTSDGALFEGGTGIGISAGKLTLKGNTRIYANGKIDETFNSVTNTLPTSGAAIQVVHAENFGDDKGMNFAGDVEIAIESGEYVSENGSPISDLYDKDNGTEGGGIKDIQISGGTFKSKQPNKPLVDSTDETFTQKNFISGGTFLSAGESMDMPTEYLAAGLTEDPETGEVISEAELEQRESERNAANTPTTTESPENPNTADSITLYLTIAAVALVGLTGTALFARKFRR